MPRPELPCPECGGRKYLTAALCRPCYFKKKVGAYIIRTCLLCKRDFRVHRSQVGNYCSLTCATKARTGGVTAKRNRIQRHCACCGIWVIRRRSEIVGNKNVFCSPECWAAFNTGENNANWSGGQSERMCQEYRKWRRAVLKRDGKRCQRCFRRDNLHVHHIQRFAVAKELRWVVSNGLTLCKWCHRRFAKREEEFAKVFAVLAETPTTVCETDEELDAALACLEGGPLCSR